MLRGCDAGADVDSDAAELVADPLALASVNASADFDSERADGIDGSRGATDRACRPVEAREEAVPGRVKLATAETRQLVADQLVMALEKVAPALIAKVCCPARRVDDVGEENRRKRPLGLRSLPGAGQELAGVRDDFFQAVAPGNMIAPRQLDIAGARDLRGLGSGRSRCGKPDRADEWRISVGTLTVETTSRTSISNAMSMNAIATRGVAASTCNRRIQA